MPKFNHIKKILVIGSGPIIIGQAAEFDYAGAQACLALKEEGIEVVLVNNNPATIMTDEEVADKIYMEPLTVASLEAIIAKEKPDGILPTLGGQTGLNLAVELADAGIIEKYQVELLGTPLETIKKGEDREEFKQMMLEISEPVPESKTVNTIPEACSFAEKIGYPVIVRPAYTLGGFGGGIANNQEELLQVAKKGLSASPIQQVLIEQSVKGWKEIEFEVVRDSNDTTIIICSMENIDPVGVHTGDSIVVAPAQTLTDRQYNMLRSVSTKVIRALGVVGGCNIQMAMHPTSEQYVLIEVNPRVSRSSALASKATGYPIARISAKLAIGYHLDEVLNPITGHTYASFEPTVDYIVTKIPRWPFDKFPHADRLLGTQMKATGEVMSLDRNFEASLLKGIRSLEVGVHHLQLKQLDLSDEELLEGLENATDIRLFLVAEAFRRGLEFEQIQTVTEIDAFFLYGIQNIVRIERELAKYTWTTVPEELLREAKRKGFADQTIADIFKISFGLVRDRWHELGWAPSYKLVDTCAGEFVAETPYYYSTWQGKDEVVLKSSTQKVLVLGSGPIRIGQGIEFDYCSVHAAKALKKWGAQAVVINNNPETVSTDYNTADQLYFEPLALEDVLNVIEKERVDGVVVQFGGQTAVNLAGPLEKMGVAIYGTSVTSIDLVEDRDLFYQLLRKLDIPHIPGITIDSKNMAVEAAGQLGYPVLLRPSYVIGGQGMVVLNNQQELETYLQETTFSFPLLVDKYVSGMEVEIDAVCDGEQVFIPGIFEHVERAGVHSGDSMAIFPAPSLNDEQRATITEYTHKIAKEIGAKGLINIQFVIDEGTIYVLEVNPRASRTVPIVSKMTGVPLIEWAVGAQLGEKLTRTGLLQDIPFYAVKGPIFSTVKLGGVDPALGPEMKSTGEVIGLSYELQEAFGKSLHWKEGVCPPLEEGDTLFISLSDGMKQEFAPFLSMLEGKKVVATPGTAAFLKEHGLTVVEEVTEIQQIQTLCHQGDIKAFVNTPTMGNKRGRFGFELRQLAVQLHIPCFTSLDTFSSYLQVKPGAVKEPLDLGVYLQRERVTI